MAVVDKKSAGTIAFKVSAYVFCALLTVMSLLPFIIMIVNSTRSSVQIQQHAISLIPSKYLFSNFEVLKDKEMFSPIRGFINSIIISTGSTICNIYFSTMTAFALVAYDWRLRKPFFTFIMAILMIPAQLTSIGFYQFMYSIGMNKNFLALILPSIAAPTTVFFMRQYMIPSLPMEILQSARIDGASEFRIFNQIALPMMKPAMATQAIFSFVGSWNNLMLPSILLTKNKLYTMPMMVQLLTGDTYKTEYGAVYLGLLLTVIPLLLVYFLLSKYIIAGVALGGVKG